MKRFGNSNNPNHNPFNNITDEQFKFMIEEGFESGKLDCYADLEGDICYRKSMQNENGWPVNIYITEQGIAVDIDYDCGGNSSNTTWWFEDGEYEKTDLNYKTYQYETVTIKKYGIEFESAWDSMIEYCRKL